MRLEIQFSRMYCQMFSTGFVRPEGCRGPHHPVDPQGSMREYPVREPCPPKCCYPDMRRSNPTCEASGTTATIWEHQSGGGLTRISHTELGDCTWRGKPMLIEEVSQCP